MKRINSDGIRVTSAIFGEGTEYVPAHENVPEGASVILTMKTFGLTDSLQLINDSHPRNVIALMNGVGHAKVLAQQLDGVPTAAGSIAVETIRSTNGTIEHKSPFARLAVPSTSNAFESVHALADTQADLTIGGTDAEVLWRKFRFLAPLALLTSYWRAPLEDALAKDPSLTQSVLAEVVACEMANGVSDTAESLAATLSALPATMRSSLQADLAAGRLNELDSIGGELIRQAKHHVVPIPAIEKIVAALSENG